MNAGLTAHRSGELANTTGTAEGGSRCLIRVIFAIAALAALLAINTILVDSKTRVAVARDGGEIVDTDVVPANVKVEGNGPPIILIHGFGAAMDWWDDIAPALATNHRVIRVDLIGHGGTAAPDSGYTIERQASLVTAILDKLGIDRFTVIGHSLGGEVATALTEAHPARVERVILIDSPPKSETTFGLGTRLALIPVVGELLSRFNTDAIIRKGLAQGFAPGFAVPEKFVADFKQLTYTAFRTAHNDSIAYRRNKSLSERLAALDKAPPVLVIFGARDALVAPASAKLYERVAGAKVVTIDSVGHSPMVEAPEKTIDLINSFLAGQP